MSKVIHILYYIFLITLISSCDTNRLYEENHSLEGNDWYADSTLSYSFFIQDTLNPSAISFNVRNSISYPYTNLYIKYSIISPSTKEEKSDLYNMILFDEKTGEPFGSGMGDIFDHQFLVLPQYTFKNKGQYIIQIKQYMRRNPLPFIMAFGVRVEKIEK